jgi:hypothetical protein
MKIGNISFNSATFKESTKEEFFEAVKGYLNIDKEDAWKLVCEANGSPEKPSVKNKKS